MDSVVMSSNGVCVEDSTAEVVLPSNSEYSNRHNVFGEPEVLPRIGAEYQAEIPYLLSGPDFILLKMGPFDYPLIGCSRPHIFHMGLPISVMWVPQVPENVKPKQQEFVSDASVESDVVELEHKIVLEDSRDVFKTQTGNRSIHKGSLLVPGSPYNLWDESEEANFLLGLYIFGKNLILVKNFMENKTIGEIMSFYYERFYGSPKYKRWSMCRKMKSRKGIYGQKIFTGLRQQELLSRLLSKVSQESQSKLLEASRAFGEGSTSLEDYVFTLKAIAGLRTLVEAFGIGKGKQDLTGIGNDHPRSTNQSVPLCSDIPIGKACSALTTAEIVTLLTGNFRLSKARSNDLFWEAVWPRLLARGWHSEQPENGISAGSRHSLVFLVPGVKKFSKGELVKGDHYFDSVSDVLNSVSAQPGLLDLDRQPVAREVGRMGGDIRWATEAKSDGEDLPNEERHCYLKPATTTQSGEAIKFTIVDTSTVYNGGRKKLRELRSIPSDISSPKFRIHFEEDNGAVGSNSGDNSSNLSMEEAILKSVKVSNCKKRVAFQQKDLEKNDLSSTNYQKKRVLEFPPRERTRPKVIKRQKKDLTDCSLRSCSRYDTSVGTRLEPEGPNCCSSNPCMVRDGNLGSLQVRSTPETLSSTNSLSMDFPVLSRHEEEKFHGTWSGIDLNLPVYPDSELTSQEVRTDAQHNNQLKPLLHYSSEGRSPSHQDNSERQPNNGRRQSSRNRPPTTKALEALAFGLFDTKKKRKNQDKFPYQTVSRPPRQGPSQVSSDNESYSAGYANMSSEDKRSDDRGCGSLFSEKSSGFRL